MEIRKNSEMFRFIILPIIQGDDGSSQRRHIDHIIKRNKNTLVHTFLYWSRGGIGEPPPPMDIRNRMDARNIACPRNVPHPCFPYPILVLIIILQIVSPPMLITTGEMW